MKRINLISFCLVIISFAQAQTVTVDPVITCKSGTYAQPYTLAKNSHHTQNSGSTVNITITTTADPGNRYCGGVYHQFRSKYTNVYISSDPYWQPYDAKITGWLAKASNTPKTTTVTWPKKINDATLNNGYFQDKVYLIATTQECIESTISGICSCEPEQLVGVVQELNIVDRAYIEIELDAERLPNRSGYQYYRFEVNNTGTVLNTVNYNWEFRVFNTYGGGNIFYQTGNGTLNSTHGTTESGFLSLPQVSGSSNLIQLKIYPSSDENSSNNSSTTYYSN